MRATEPARRRRSEKPKAGAVDTRVVGGSASSRAVQAEDSERREAALSRAEEYSLKKELASTERKLDTLGTKAEAIRAEMKETESFGLRGVAGRPGTASSRRAAGL